MLKHTAVSGTASRFVLLLLGSLLAAVSGAGCAAGTPEAEGALVSRGAGERADRHQLPPHAIDTPDLPHTLLTANDSEE